MKKFNAPEVEVIRFNSVDGLTAEILAVSGGNGGPNESEILGNGELQDNIPGEYN